MTEYRTLGEFCEATAGVEHDQAVEAVLQWMVAELSSEADCLERIGATVNGLHFSAGAVRDLAADKADLIRQYRALVREAADASPADASPSDEARNDDDDDLAAWLRSVLDEEEAAAWQLHRNAQEVRQELKDPRLLGKPMPGWGLWPAVERMAAGVLTDITAKRAILHEYMRTSPRAVAHAVRLLATAYADRDGYREEWSLRTPA